MFALASDLDGTLVFDGKIKETDLEAIRQFQKHGNLFGICSGRTPAGIYLSTDGVIDCDFYIASSGSVILNKQKEIIYADYLDPDLTIRLCQAYNNRCIVLVQSYDHYYSIQPMDFFPEAIHMDSLEEIRNFEICGVSFVAKSIEEAGIINAEMMEKFPELAGHQNKDSIDITTKNCSKGKAVLKVKELLGIDCIGAIGDSFNDSSMIIASDTGFTFPYAPISVQNQADCIVESVQEALERMENKNV